MGQEKPPGLAFQNRSERPSPEFQVDVGRRSRRHNKRMSLDADARGVTHEGRSLEVLEIADVMRSMPRRVRHCNFARAERNRFSAFQNAEILRRYRHHFAEQFVQIVRPEPRRACQQFRGIDHVRRTEFVDVHRESGIFVH